MSVARNQCPLPSETDWRREAWTLDIPYAYKHFLGKTREEAVQLFVENSLLYQEDIMFMPAACFRYYVHSYMDYLMSDQSAGDSDGASCFFGVVDVRHDDVRCADEHLKQTVRNVLARLASRQSWYDASPEIYGDFGVRADACLKLLA